jgi:REP element-mobilizing transposase RayT
VRFDARQRLALVAGLGQAIAEGGYLVHACCIGHDHSHLVVGRHERSIEQIARHLKSKATMAMTRVGLHPLSRYHKSNGTVPTPWSESIWSVFINDEAQREAAIRYVKRHPMKEGLQEQNWPFVVPLQ